MILIELVSQKDDAFHYKDFLFLGKLFSEKFNTSLMNTVQLYSSKTCKERKQRGLWDFNMFQPSSSK